MKRALLFALAALPLALAACGGNTVGRSCTKTSECEPGQTCYLNAPGGACTKGCSMEGTAKDCPGGTICAQNLGQLLCSPTCTDDAQCRTDYKCSPVAESTKLACTAKAQ